MLPLQNNCRQGFSYLICGFCDSQQSPSKRYFYGVESYIHKHIHTHAHTHTPGTHSVMQKKYFKWFEDNTAEETRQCLFHRAQMELYKINWHAEKLYHFFYFSHFDKNRQLLQESKMTMNKKNTAGLVCLFFS